MPTTNRYEIEIRGRASDRLLRPVVDDFQIAVTDHGTTLMVGEIRDASHLNGLLAHFTSMNVEVIELRRVDGTELIHHSKPTTHSRPTTPIKPTTPTTNPTANPKKEEQQ